MGEKQSPREDQEDDEDRRRAPLRRLSEDLRRFKDQFESHVREEHELFLNMRELGSAEQIRQRRIFIEAWIKREEDRAKLRTSLIEKGLLMGLLALLSWLGIAVYHELAAAVKMMIGK